MVGGHLGFDAGSLKPCPDTMRILNEIAEHIVGHTNIILVKGHASLDDLPDDASAEQKMDISLRRAQAAADYLMSKGVLPEVLRVQGCSTFEPVRHALRRQLPGRKSPRGNRNDLGSRGRSQRRIGDPAPITERRNSIGRKERRKARKSRGRATLNGLAQSGAANFVGSALRTLH